MEWHKGDVRMIWICTPITYASVVHSTWPSQAMWRMHAPTFKKLQKKNKNKNVILHMLTHGAMWGCGLASFVVCIFDTFCDIRERNVTIRSEIWTTNMRSLGFHDIRECVTLWGLILRSLRCAIFFDVGPLAWPMRRKMWRQFRATSHTSQEPWPWNCESLKESVQRLSQHTSKLM
jgi:hypothetical protein